MQCPLCHTNLPDDAATCTHCDWVRPEESPSNDSNWIAAALSIVPGLGHLYKGHLVPGLLLLCLLGPLYLLIVFWLIPLTYGVSLLLPGLFVVLVGYQAYSLPKVRPSDMEAQATSTLREWQKYLQRAGK